MNWRLLRNFDDHRGFWSVATAARHEAAVRAATDGGPVTKDFAVVADNETAKCLQRFHDKMEGQHHTDRLRFYSILEKCKADIARAAS